MKESYRMSLGHWSPIAAIVALALCIAGCSASPIAQRGAVPNVLRPIPQATVLGGSRTRPKLAGWLSPDVKRIKRRIYAADDDEILIYPMEGYDRQSIGTISSGVYYAYGLYVNKRDSLYVANAANSTVTVYKRSSITPARTYTEDLSRPLYPVVDASGDLFVGNANTGAVVEYRHGSTKAYEELQTLGIEADGMDFDPQGNLYVAYRLNDSSDGGGIEKFAPGSTQGQNLGMTLNQPQGLAVDSNGNILVAETGGASRVDLFPPGDTMPTAEVPVSDSPTQVVLKENEHQLYISALDGEIFRVKYPFRSSPRLRIKDDGVFQGVAIGNDQTF